MPSAPNWAWRRCRPEPAGRERDRGAVFEGPQSSPADSPSKMVFRIPEEAGWDDQWQAWILAPRAKIAGWAGFEHGRAPATTTAGGA
jgi:hypothetical protein